MRKSKATNSQRASFLESGADFDGVEVIPLPQEKLGVTTSAIYKRQVRLRVAALQEGYGAPHDDRDPSRSQSVVCLLKPNG